jgi:signal transduction histidine kinase
VTAFLAKLPPTLVLAVLVGTFLVLRKHTSGVRVRLWTAAWALIFVHFFVQAFETHTGLIEQLIESVDLAALELSGIVFVVSLTRAGEDRFRRLLLLAALGAPAVFHAFASTLDWHAHRVLALAVTLVAISAAAGALFDIERPGSFQFTLALLILATGLWAVKRQLAGSPDFAVNAILTGAFALSGMLFWRRYLRRSPGVLIVASGFLAWGAVFPAATAFAHYLPQWQINPEIWNVPKFLVAFGMVLTLIEEKSRIIESARERERAENLLLSRLSQISSRLLTEREPIALVGEIVTAVTEASSFCEAALLLVAERNSVHLAGSSGLSSTEQAALLERSATWLLEGVNVPSGASDFAPVSFAVSHGEHEVVVPLVSYRGSHLGWLWLSRPKSVRSSANSEVVKLEILAADLAVAIENSRLHHRLVRSEKLAALGQLVAGVAHELNNPLTGIMGYAELLGEEPHEEKTSKRIQKLANEARRMQRIVEGLLRFARQSNPAVCSADLEAALRDVVHLREYHLRKSGIQVDVHVEPDLPAIAVGEDELKQVLLNLLNNAVDAVEESAQRAIRVSASHQQGRVVFEIEDSGPGFAELGRALDPFYTTKPVGKGTGLGLSICYGIMQECGGEISLANQQPYGASVKLEFPLAVGQPLGSELLPA